MEVKELEAALEGILFAAGEPVGVERLCLSLETDRPTPGRGGPPAHGPLPL